MADIKVREGSILAVVVDETANSIVFNVRGAAPDGGSKSITLSMSSVSPANIAYAALHGMKQRIADMAALSRNPETGKAATPHDKFAAISRGVEHYASGSTEWNLRSTGEGRESGELTMLAYAISQIKGKNPDEVKTWLKTKSASERKALALAPAIKPIMDELRAKESADIDAEAMLGELV